MVHPRAPHVLTVGPFSSQIQLWSERSGVWGEGGPQNVSVIEEGRDRDREIWRNREERKHTER